ncbi:hypothetical protein A2164_01075 [Candidatus Curtissbacteria bacterium RBG_13_35_7]|uniref:Uncharacterized protein n=1 Tax=Candidatus Curtissbacteria bacterium RBG_13_35_7 TaxID=1797705 RepID=A0A1F5G0Q0_9BACT|nr:MAG: hypothetical protein A2164_01075 [Candidatus Curtissbacteria bacterium RBG_13_35_7]
MGAERKPISDHMIAISIEKNPDGGAKITVAMNDSTFADLERSTDQRGLSCVEELTGEAFRLWMLLSSYLTDPDERTALIYQDMGRRRRELIGI